MVKPVQDWLDTLPEPYRSLALKNHSSYNKIGNADCLPNALVLAFKWSSTIEGSVYWKSVHEMCLNNKFPKGEILRSAKNTYKPKTSKRIYPKKPKVKPKAKAVVKVPIIKPEQTTGTYKSHAYPSLDEALEAIFKNK